MTSFIDKKRNKEELLTIGEFLKYCRDIYCHICIHHIILSCDDAL